jgi:hypothetical protein
MASPAVLGQPIGNLHRIVAENPRIALWLCAFPGNPDRLT